MSHFPDERPSHELVFVPLGEIPKRGLHLSIKTRDALEAEAADTGLPLLAVIRAAIERGAKVAP